MKNVGLTNEQEKRMIAAHKLGIRDAVVGRVETHPIHPYERFELEAYRAGYWGERKRQILKHAVVEKTNILVER